MMKLIIRYAMCCVILAARLHQSLAICCRSGLANRYCSSYCCGRGACNIFCCNCGHKGHDDADCNDEYWSNYHARKHYRVWHGKRSIVNETEDYLKERLLKDTKELFQTIDVDGDNFLTLEESEFYLKNYKGLKRSTSDHTLEREIMRIDINNDGMISPKEFDESL